MTTRTLSEAEDAAPVARVDHLYDVVDAGRPLGGARHALVDVDEVMIGRGTIASARREPGRLRLERADPWLSTEHASLVREGAHWTLTDHGSRNGAVVNGVRQQRAILLDGDLIELGRSFFILRLDQPAGAVDLELAPGQPPDPLATLDPALARAFAELRQIAPSTVPVLIAGPTGAGKERAARALHQHSGRAGRFVAVNCGALPGGLVESELFGHRRGAFSGAVDHHEGLIAASSGGTLFLDEIGDLAPPAQAALLRVLEDREVRPVGATAGAAVDLRVVAASHRDLDERALDGEFREDLLARLAGFELRLPPLAARRVDLGLMLAELLPAGAALSAPAARALLQHAWPRNVRELGHALARAVALAGAAEIQLDHLPDDVARAARTPAAPPPTDERRAELAALLEKHGGNVSQVATELGRVRSQVQRWLKRYGLDPARYRR